MAQICSKYYLLRSKEGTVALPNLKRTNAFMLSRFIMLSQKVMLGLFTK